MLCTLALPAENVGGARRQRHPTRRSPATRPPPCAGWRGRRCGDHQRLGDDRADLQARVERGERILEDHLHLAAHGAQRPRVEGAQVRAVELDLAGGRLDQPQQRARQDAWPDSPTMPSVSPLCTSKLTPSTARTVPLPPRGESLASPPHAAARSWHGVPAGGLVTRFEFLERRHLDAAAVEGARTVAAK